MKNFPASRNISARRRRSQVIPSPTLTTLRTLPLLAELPDAQLQTLLTVCEWCQYKPGRVIVRQNEAAERVFFIASGVIKVQRGERPGTCTVPGENPERRARPRPRSTLGLVGPGDIVGELGPLLGCGRSASIIALTTCQLLSLPGEHFLGSLMNHPPFALALTRKLAQRLVDTSSQVDLMSSRVEDRIRALFRHCHSLGVDIEHSLSNAEIARMIGASRVAVSQLLNGPGKGRRNAPSIR